MQNLTAVSTWTDELSHLHINVLELRAVWLGLQAFCHKLDNATIALMSDNTSAAYLRNQGGDKIPFNERSSSRHIPLGRRSGNDISTQTHPQTFECVSGPSVKESPNPKDNGA